MQLLKLLKSVTIIIVAQGEYSSNFGWVCAAKGLEFIFYLKNQPEKLHPVQEKKAKNGVKEVKHQA